MIEEKLKLLLTQKEHETCPELQILLDQLSTEETANQILSGVEI